MYFKLLGPLEVEDRGEPVEIRGAKQRVLLASLLLAANRTVSRGKLIDELWGEHAPDAAGHRLEEHVSRLRKTLDREGEASIVTRPSGYALRVPDEAVDTSLFEELIDQGRTAVRETRLDDAVKLLREALGLWRGTPLSDLPLDTVDWPEVRQLQERRLTLHEQLMEAELARGHHAEIVGELEPLVVRNPLRERLRILLMLALYRSGRQADALAICQEARRAFAEELGIEPGPVLKELERAILRQDPSLDLFQPGEGRLPPLPNARIGYLPRPASSLVGREEEIAGLAALVLAGSRLITLTGPGGSGKTRLALEAAYRAVPDFPDGVFWVGLAPLRDPGLVAGTVSRALGAKDGTDVHIGDRRLLLLLDNFEQVIEAATEVATMVEACPNLVVVVTSRELLRVKGEAEYEVQPLNDAEAVELFCVRAQTPPHQAVADLCRRLDNLPLAIEFAAARTSVASPRQILERISQRLDLLKGGRDAESRQRTLRATIEWSYELLSVAEQRLFARLAVFTGGCTLEAAEEVAEAELDDLQSLVDKSLLRHSEERFWMLETIHEFALERLEDSGEADRMRRRHAAFFLALARKIDGKLLAHSQESVWLERLDRDYHNLTEALLWAAGSSSAALGLRFAASLGRFWIMRGRLEEGRLRLAEALSASPAASTRLRARALGSAASLAHQQGDFLAARGLAEEAASCFRSLGDAHGLGVQLPLLMLFAGFEGKDRLVGAVSEELVSLCDRLGDEWEYLNANRLHNLAVLALTRGDFAEARVRIEAELEIAHKNDWQAMIANALCDLAHVAEAEQRPDEAWALWADALRRCQELSWLQNIRASFVGIGLLAATSGDLERAACLFGAAETLANETREGDEPFGRQILDRLERLLNAGLEDVRRATLVETGHGMSLEDAVQYASAVIEERNRKPVLAAI